MKQSVIIASVIIVVACGALIAYQKSSEHSAQKDAVATNQVNIVDYSLKPTVIKIKVGTTVTWTNNDSVKHELASYDGRLPSGPVFAPGQTYAHTFTKVGTYKYYCKIYPNVKGIVVVTE